MATPLNLLRQIHFEKFADQHPIFSRAINTCLQIEEVKISFLINTLFATQSEYVKSCAKQTNYTYFNKDDDELLYPVLCGNNKIYIIFDRYREGMTKRVSRMIDIETGALFIRKKIIENQEEVLKEEKHLASLSSPYIEKSALLVFKAVEKNSLVSRLFKTPKMHLHLLKEYYPRDLIQVFKDLSPGEIPPLKHRMNIFCDILRGVDYLADRKHIHGDLKPDNIHIIGQFYCDELMKAVLGDLEFSCLFNERFIGGPALWAAPEVYTPKEYPGEIYMEKRDVFCAMLLGLFLFTDCRLISAFIEKNKFDQAKLDHLILRATKSRGTFFVNDDIHDSIMILLMYGLKVNPYERHDIKIILKRALQIQERIEANR